MGHCRRGVVFYVWSFNRSWGVHMVETTCRLGGHPGDTTPGFYGSRPYTILPTLEVSEDARNKLFLERFGRGLRGHLDMVTIQTSMDWGDLS